jgi:hypothetical protein
VRPAADGHRSRVDRLRERSVQDPSTGRHQRAALARQHAREQQHDTECDCRPRDDPAGRRAESLAEALARDPDRHDRERSGGEGTGVDAVAGREREHDRAVPALERHDQARDAE